MTVDDEPWSPLRRHTAARIALGRAGDGLPTRRLLEFQLDHALARDSVHMRFEPARVEAALRAAPGFDCDILSVSSAASDRALYLQRPDLGRRLAPESRQHLRRGDWDVLFVIADGLSPRAVHGHAATLLLALLPFLTGWRIGPVVLARQARVALADPIGEALGARMTVMLIGERPGLSSPDSLGAYLTWGPRTGRHDAERNCVSNIRPDGLAPDAAAAKLAWLMGESRRRGFSGVALKDEAPEALGAGGPAPVLPRP